MVKSSDQWDMLGDLEGFHVPENEEPFANGVSRVPAFAVDVLLEDRGLHIELVDPVVEEEDFFGFGVGILGG